MSTEQQNDAPVAEAQANNAQTTTQPQITPSSSFSEEHQENIKKCNSFESVDKGGQERRQQELQTKPSNGENEQSVIDYKPSKQSLQPGSTTPSGKKSTGYSKPPRNPTPPKDKGQQNAARQFILWFGSLGLH